MKTSEAISPTNQKHLIEAAGQAYDNFMEFDGDEFHLYAKFNETLGLAESIEHGQIEFDFHSFGFTPSQYQSAPFEYLGLVDSAEKARVAMRDLLECEVANMLEIEKEESEQS